MEIYTTGGGYYLTDIFNYIAAYTSSGNFNNLLWIGSMIGVFMFGWSLIFGATVREFFKFFAVVAIVGGLCLGPRTNVVIIDKTKGALPIYATVANVPYGIALIGNVTSSMSYYVTQQMEALLSTPTNMTYQESGMMFGATIMSQAARWRSVSNLLHTNLVSFMDNCVVDGINLGHMDLDAVVRSGNLAATLDADLPNSLSYYDTTTNTTTLCQTGWTNIKAQMTAEVPVVLQNQAASLYQDSPSTGAANVAKLTGTLGDFQTLMGMASASATDTVRQSMLIHSLDDSITQFIANSGNAAAMGIYQSARAEAQTRSSYSAIGANALSWVPILKIVFEAIYYAAFPLVLMIMLTPLGIRVLPSYIGGFVWLASWEPISAILHSIVLKSSTGFYRSAGFLTSDGSISDVVLSWSNHFAVQAVEQDVGAMAGYLMMSVPFLAYAITLGAGRMMGLATSMLAVGQGAAIEAGREGASGNIALSNMSMSNMAANKYNTSMVQDHGRFTSVMGDGASVTYNRDGSSSIASGSAVSNTSFSPVFSAGLRREMSKRAETAQSAVASASKEFSDYIGNSAATLAEQGRNAAQTVNSSSDVVTNMGSEDRRSFNESWNAVESFSKKHGLSTRVGLQAMLAGSAGVSRGMALKIGADLSAKGSLSGDSIESFANAVDASKSMQNQTALSNFVATSDTIRAGTSNAQSETASESQRFSFDKGERLANSLQRRTSEAQSYAQASAALESQGLSGNTGLSQVVYSSLRDSGMSPEQISAIMNPKSINALGMQKNVMDELARDVSSFYGLGITGADPREGFVGNDSFPRVANQNDNKAAHKTYQELVAKSDAMRADAMAKNSAHFDQQHSAQDAGETKGETAYYGNRGQSMDGLNGTIGGHMLGRSKDIGQDALEGIKNTASSAAGAVRSAFGGEAPQPTQQPSNGQVSLSAADRDLAIRTVLGEAANQGNYGQAAVAHVIKNRVMDGRWADNASEVVLQPRSFSAWNTDGSGNSIAASADPQSEAYQKAGRIVDRVFSGEIDDFTRGATHYYSPKGMNDLVSSGYQSNHTPRWLADEQDRRGEEDTIIGGHIFTGRVRQGG